MFTFEFFGDITDQLRRQWAGFMYDALTTSRNVSTRVVQEFTSRLDSLESILRQMVASKAQDGSDQISVNLETVSKSLAPTELQKEREMLGRTVNSVDVPTTTGLVMWLDASDISSLFQASDGKDPVAAGNQLVGLWKDKSGNNNHFSQSRKEACPCLVKEGIGRKPSVMFNTAQSIFMTKTFPAPVTVIYVTRQMGGSNKRVLSAMTNNWLLGYWSGAKNQAFYEGWVSKAGRPDTDNLSHVFSGIVRGPGQNSEVWADGEMVATNQNGNTGPGGLAINTGMYSEEVSDCQVAEIIVFNRDISQSERQDVEAYLKAKWGINIPAR